MKNEAGFVVETIELAVQVNIGAADTSTTINYVDTAVTSLQAPLYTNIEAGTYTVFGLSVNDMLLNDAYVMNGDLYVDFQTGLTSKQMVNRSII